MAATETTTTDARSVRPAVPSALLADAALVTLFAGIGFATHSPDAVSAWGVAMTAWPFLVALAVGWVVSVAWRAPLAPLRTGVPVWLVTVGGGMLLRVLLGQGTALPFVIVATVTLLVLLVGWRLIAAAVRRARTRAR
ncbi:DUF3054 domain-containing protein [Agrococcus lahaulensis]|nr:DUF3054 domain-containing protein [Agrococcus lahaulensis]